MRNLLHYHILLGVAMERKMMEAITHEFANLEAHEQLQLFEDVLLALLNTHGNMEEVSDLLGRPEAIEELILRVRTRINTLVEVDK